MCDIVFRSQLFTFTVIRDECSSVLLLSGALCACRVQRRIRTFRIVENDGQIRSFLRSTSPGRPIYVISSIIPNRDNYLSIINLLKLT